MDHIRSVQMDVGSNRHYVRFGGRNYQCSLVAEASAFRDGEHVTVEPSDNGTVIVIRADGWRETWSEPNASCVDAGNYGASDWSGT